MNACPTNPLQAVLAAFGSGAVSLDDVARTTCLPRDVVGAAVDHLVRAGRISAEQLSIGCPDGDCGRCVFGNGGFAACDGGRSLVRSGAVLTALTVHALPAPAASMADAERLR